MLVVYPGHLGPTTTCPLRRADRAARFTAGQVRDLPDPDGRDLCRLGGFHQALPLEEAAERFGLPAERLAADPSFETCAAPQPDPEPATEAQLAALKADTLRALAEHHDLPTDGPKADLAARLRAAGAALPTPEPPPLLVLSPATLATLRRIRQET